MRGRRLLVATAIVSVVGLGLPFSSAGASSTPKLKVKLIEFKVTPAREFNAAGKTKFVVKNKGTEVHEFVIVRGDDASALPTKADGSVDEDALSKDDEVGEIEDIDPKKTDTKAFKMKAGDYILFCNIVEEEDDGTVVSHFAEGMHTTVNFS